MYYKLNKKYAFRGWERLPYAIRCMEGPDATERPVFLNKKHFLTALKCNGVENVSEDELDEEESRIISEMVTAGYVTSSEEPMGRLEPYQRYQLYKGTYLESVLWSITGRCNYRCRHCLVSAPTAKHPELPLSEIERIADQIKECGIRMVDLTGGEPLVRNDFLNVVRIIAERGINIGTIFTNTKLLTAELLDQMEALGQHPNFQISYDGWGHHDWLRGIAGAEEEAKAACELLCSRGYGYVIAACVHKGNANSLRPLWRYLAEHGARALRVNSPQILGEWHKYADEYALSQEEAWGVYQQAITDWYEDGMPIGLELDGFFAGKKGEIDYRVTYAKHISDSLAIEKLPYCESVRYHAYISPEGSIMPCMGFADTSLADSFPSIIGDGCSMGSATSNPDSLYFKVQRTTISDMVNDTVENPECAGCEFLRSCLGGCMLEGTTPEGNHHHRDERCCWFFKNVGEEGVHAVARAAIERFVPGGLDALEKEKANKGTSQEVSSSESFPC